jgi:uncharacterized phiE125 gp8 family phage protein
LHAVSILVEPPADEPVTIADVKLRAELDWLDGDPRDALATQLIQTAREFVEADTGLALLTQTRDVFFDHVPPCATPILLPTYCAPVQTVLSWQVRTQSGVVALDPTSVTADQGSNPGRIVVAPPSSGPWPSVYGLQPWALRLVVGWPTPQDLPPRLVHAVGLLAAHLLTAGRDAVTVMGRGGHDQIMPLGYEDAVDPYRAVTVL